MRDVPISELPLKPRAKRLLLTKYQNVNQFTSQAEILKIKGFGLKSHFALLAALRTVDVDLPLM